MRYEDHDDDQDEDWYDTDDEANGADPDEDRTAPCPTCGDPIYAISDRCPACGHWLTEAERNALWAETSKPAWVTITAVIVLALLVLSLLGGWMPFF
jgi:hypothetical protein